eukprot:jgi/Picre1/27137/NNA_000107.t2
MPNRVKRTLVQFDCEQALGSIRTVLLQWAGRTISAYDEALKFPEQVGTKQGIFNGLTIGMTMCTAYCGYALAMWYGATSVQMDTPEGCCECTAFSLIGGLHWDKQCPIGVLSTGGEEPDSVTGEMSLECVLCVPRVSGEGVLEVAHEAEEIAEEIVSAVARTSSHVVSAAESGEVITTTSPEKKASKKKKKVVEENS